MKPKFLNVFCDILRTMVKEDMHKEIELEKRKQRRKRLWVRNWIARREQIGASARLFRELETEDPRAFMNIIRMTTVKFAELLEMIQGEIQRQDTVMRTAVPAKLKLELTLRFLATGDSFRSLSYLFRIPVCTISLFVPEVLNAISKALAGYTKVPLTEDEWKKEAKLFLQMWNFPRCCGAIDGKHINIKRPAKSAAEFYNYKGFYSIILFALVDAQYCFRYINVGANGRTGDAALFRDSSLYDAFENNTLKFPEDHVILGDDAFPLKTYLLKPYSKHHLTKRERIFNYRLSRARRVVENAFGILTWRFRIFLRPIECKPSTVDKIVWAACSLHNWLRMTQSSVYTPAHSFDLEDLNTGEIIPGLWREVCENLLSVKQGGSNNYGQDAEKIRKQYMNYFCDEGGVNWQWNAVGLSCSDDLDASVNALIT